MGTRCLCSVFLALGFIAGAAADEAKFLMRVTPTEFFSGELKRLKPHVDFEAECFKIEKRASVRCRPVIEMWCDGERVDGAKYGFLTDEQADEVALSWRRKVVDKQVEYHLAVGGLKQFKRRIKEPKSAQKVNVAFGPVSISKAVELKAKGDSAVVWAMGDGHGADLGKAGEVDKMLKTAPWVLILRIHVEEGKR